MSEILLENAYVIDAEGKQYKNKDIRIKEGIIQSITDHKGAEKRDFEGEIIDCSSLVVTPGFANIHVHSAMNIFRGIAEDVSSERWFNEYIWPYESKMTAEDVHIGSVLGMLEMLNNGVTTICDHYFNENEVLKAVQETGIRADMAPTLFGSAENYKERLAEVTRFISEHQNESDKIALRMGPHAPYTCPPDTLAEMVAEAKNLHTGIHIHVSETKEQVIESKKTYGKTPFQILAEAGGFDVSCIVAHGVWLEDTDLPYINDQTYFALCPKTYMKSAVGDGNIYRLRNQVQYSFGSDGAASSNTLNSLEQARIFALIGKYNGHDAEQYTVQEVWQALMRGHRATTFHSGQIAEGWNADLLLWDLNQPNTFPYYDPLTTILYSSDSSNIMYTMVGGTFVKREGLLCQDMSEIMKRVGEAKEQILKRGKGKAIVVY